MLQIKLQKSTHFQLLIGFHKLFFQATIFEPIEKHAIYWSDFSLLKADFVCMKELLKRNKKWSYFINQAGTVMPQVIKLLRCAGN